MAIKTLAEVAEWYEVSERTMHNWISEGLALHHKGGKGSPHLFNTVDVHKWLQIREIKSRVVTKDGKHYDKQEEEARLKHHQANMEQLKEEEKRGELIPVDVAVSEFGQLVGNARAKILQLSKLVPTKHREKLNDGITLALNELSEADAVI